MELIDDHLLKRQAAPVPIVPSKRSRIDDPGRTVNAIRLETGCWIWSFELVVQPVPIGSSRQNVFQGNPPVTSCILLHGQDTLFGQEYSQVNFIAERSPDPECAAATGAVMRPYLHETVSRLQMWCRIDLSFTGVISSARGMAFFPMAFRRFIHSLTPKLSCAPAFSINSFGCILSVS